MHSSRMCTTRSSSRPGGSPQAPPQSRPPPMGAEPPPPLQKYNLAPTLLRAVKIAAVAAPCERTLIALDIRGGLCNCDCLILTQPVTREFFSVIMAYSHSTGLAQGQGLGNDGFLYYAMYCIHYRGIATGTGTVSPCPCPGSVQYVRTITADNYHKGLQFDLH